MAADRILHVVFLVDITGSMGTQIEGVKAMVSEFCAVDRPGVALHLHTFTETTKQSFVTMTSRDMSQSDVRSYVWNKLKLNSPPDMRETNAYGGDGPENSAAGLAFLMKKFTSSDNVITFLITDADPHYRHHGTSQEAQREAELLRENGYPTDIFQVLNLVCETLNITLVPIIYSTPDLRWYTQGAALTNGLILFPQHGDSRLLASGLGALLTSLQARVLGGGAAISEATLHELRGFRVSAPDTDNFEPLEEDPGVRASGSAHVTGTDDMRGALGRLLDTATDRFKGKRATKRVKGVDTNAAAASVKFFVVSMLEALGRTDLLGEEGALATEVRDEMRKLAETDKSVVSPLILEPLPPLTAEEIGASEGAVQCAVLLESAVGAITSLKELPIKNEEDLTKWLTLTIETLMVRFVDVRFPRDKLNPALVDFADAWAANIRSVSTSSVVSALAAIGMRAETSSDGHLVYKDPMSKKEYSTALIIAHPDDAVLTRGFQVLSGLPVLHGVIQGNLVSGGYQLFPSLSPGLTSAALVQMAFEISAKGRDPTEAEWEVMRSLLWTLKKQTIVPAMDIVRSLRDGKGFNNPSDAIPKLVAALLAFLRRKKMVPTDSPQPRVLKELFEEMTAGRVAAIQNVNNRRAADGKEPIYPGWLSPEEIGRCFLEDWDFDKVKPLEELHPCEIFAAKRETESTKAPERDAPGWEKRLGERLAETELFKGSYKAHQLLCRIVVGADVKARDPSRAIPTTVQGTLDEDTARGIMVESALLGRRPARFELMNADEPKDQEWRRRDPSEYSLIEMGRSIVADCVAPQVKAWWEQRSTFARDTLVKMVEDKVIKKVPGGKLSAEKEASIVAQMREKLTTTVLGREFKLSRMDVPDLLTRVPKEKMDTVGKILVLGGWTTMEPSSLRRSYKVILELFEGCESQDAIKEALLKTMTCKRESGPNRHGHSLEFPWPGPLGWTKEYQEARLKATPAGTADPERWRRAVERSCEWMRKCTEAGEVLPPITRVKRAR
ncbi:hypothetical protein M427DRAFT_141809 [Gonapodya prolifera JEL478]|uniref:VWFA domain-containing protein n=1 Tax=Gonapodya prolifera (strain JEL478) TaxID=1344416 RepID=A0A139AZY4_GONPJ|nr:hypothetical protein M427DRAFT_141809 [Gonapodya prolifera JEL478]|eukprot:KXS22289.1 hypothetical protein M427DRAFT_141809 [Gonapodya prolifera JEL478]